jgi:hypothetical protein
MTKILVDNQLIMLLMISISTSWYVKILVEMLSMSCQVFELEFNKFKSMTFWLGGKWGKRLE